MGCGLVSQGRQTIDLEGPVDTSLVFKKPLVDFLSRRGQKVKISADTANVSSGVIRMEGGVSIQPLGVQNLRRITAQRGVILSDTSDPFLGLNTSGNLANTGSKLELEGDVVAQLLSGKISVQRLSFDPQARLLWSKESTYYRGPRAVSYTHLTLPTKA